MKVIVLFILVFVPLRSCNLTVTSSLQKLEKKIKPIIFEIIDRSITGKCAKDLKLYTKDLFNLKLWALEMLDATGKIHPGILNGNIMLFGNYDECLNIYYRRKKRVVQGQYCSFYLEPQKNSTHFLASLVDLEKSLAKFEIIKNEDVPIARLLRVTAGVCVPKSCSFDHLNDLWKFIQQNFNLPVDLSFGEQLCTYKEKPVEPYKIDSIIFIYFGIAAAVIALSTFCDIYLRRKNVTPICLHVCSVYTNTKRLLSTHCENDTLTCLYGIKSLATLWIVLGHYTFLKSTFSNINAVYILTHWKEEWINSFFFASFYSVDTFITISGILIIYVHLKYLEKYNINVLYFYLHRFSRLTPALFVMVLFNISVFKHLSDGPAWPTINRYVGGSCYSTGWITLTFLTNYLPHQYKCVPQTWYLTIDTQMYIIAPIFFYIYKHYPRKLLLSMIALCTACLVYTFTTIIRKQISCGFYFIMTSLCLLHFAEKDSSDCQNYIYFSLPSRVSCWLIGAIFGYFLYKTNNFKDHRYTKVIKLLVIFSISFLALLTFSYIPYTKLQKNNVIFSAFINTFLKVFWSLAVCFVIYSCIIHQKGVVNRFLSHPVFIVFGKLTYSVFLTHISVLFAVSAGNQREAGYFSTFQLFYDFWGVLLVTILTSYVLCVLSEAPVYTALKVMDKYAGGLSDIETKNQEESCFLQRLEVGIVKYFLSAKPTNDIKKNK